MHSNNAHITIVTPVFNEERSIPVFYDAVQKATAHLPYTFDMLFVDDGSTDNSTRRIEELAKRDKNVRALKFSRNFGKEAATSAGLHQVYEMQSDAAILIDADLQHPVELIPAFLKKWKEGAELVVGVRMQSKSDSMIKRLGGNVFYAIMRRISDTHIIPHATDYRLIDRIVVAEYHRFTERRRITRGLIDWLGFETAYVHFEAHERAFGGPSYTLGKLWQLGIAAITAHSLFPLRLAGYIGALITALSIPLGILMFTDRFIHSFGFHFSGPAILADIILFLIGIVLMCIGLLAFYIGHIFQETQNRPMYVIHRRIP